MSLRLVRNGKALLGVVLALFLAAFLAACETSSGSSGGTEPRPTNELLFGFEVESVNIAEDFSQGDVVATAALTIDGEAPTAEQLNELVVSITPSDAPFALSVATGELRTTAPLDFETASSYALTIELTYAAGTPTSATLRVDLSNVDERSISYTLPDDGVIRVAEDIAAGSEVFSASITIDGEPVAAEDGLSLALEPSDAPFAIDNAGTITTTAALDYETTARYEITLVASAVDGSLRLPFVIEVDNVARPISYALPDPVSISEASAVGTALFSPQVLVGGEAPTAADGLKFTLTPNPPSSEGVPFAIDSTGTIITTDDLDYEGTTSSYDVSLSVASSTNNDIVAFSADFTIAVEDVVEQEGSRNLAIAFNPVSPVDVAESAANGDTVSTASVLVDGAAPTTADGVTFSLGTTDVPFEIDSSTGEITTTAALDYEDTTSYTLTVVANAVNANTASTNLLVNVTNVFENTLVLAAQTLSIAEDASGGDSVGTLTASVSPSGSVTFVDPGDSRFAVNPTTGEVTLKSGASLDHETTPSYTLEVAASSPDADGVQATITINVTNVLESTITFAAQTLSIPENSAAGTSAGSLTAAIAPAVGVTFGGPNSYFAVASDGEVTVKDGASIDYETLPNSYVFTVTASNDDALSVTATITVTVSDIEQEGTALEPFAVSSLSELQSIATGFSNLYVGSNCAYILGCSEGSLSAAASLKQTYSLGANIDVSDTSDADYNSATGTTGGGTGDVGNGFLPIGSCGSDCGNTDAPAPFSGSFDGQGYEITGLHIERDATGSLRGAGLFSSLSGRVENLRLQELSVHGDAYTGAVAGHVTGTGALSEVFVQGVVEGDNAPTGGLVGELWGSIEDSAVLGLVRGTSNTGGLVGLNESNSSTTGSIVRSLASVYLAASGTKGGGLVGENRGNISSSFANATVYGVSGSPHGGLIGQQDGGQVEHCYATGAVISSGATAGGLIGNFSFGSFSDCYASVLARGVSNVGGLVGQGLGSVSDIRSYWNTDQTSAGVGLELPGTGISGGHRPHLRRAAGANLHWRLLLRVRGR